MKKLRTRQRGKTFSYAFEVGIIGGKRKTIEKGGFASNEEAYNAGLEAINQWNHGGIVADSKMSFADFAKVWKDANTPQLKETTVASYNSIITVLNKEFGSRRLCDIKPLAVDLWVKETSKTRSKNYMRSQLNLLKQILNYAVYPAELLQANPAQNIKLPLHTGGHKIERYIIPLTDYEKLLLTLDYPCRIAIHLSYHTGMRIGEVCGLTWEDIDLDNAKITIRRQIQHGEHRSIYSTTKTPKSEREIQIDRELISALEEQKRWQKGQEESYGKYYTRAIVLDDDTVIRKAAADVAEDDHVLNLVLTYKYGGFFIPSSLRQKIKKKNKTVKMNFHSLRHTNTTMLIENGAPVKDVSARLGHAHTNITMDLYTHETQAMKQKSVDVLENIFTQKKTP
jgi:integrase